MREVKRFIWVLGLSLGLCTSLFGLRSAQQQLVIHIGELSKTELISSSRTQEGTQVKYDLLIAYVTNGSGKNLVLNTLNMKNSSINYRIVDAQGQNIHSLGQEAILKRDITQEYNNKFKVSIIFSFDSLREARDFSLDQLFLELR